MLQFNFSPFPRLETERLLLRRPDPIADLKPLHRHRMAEDVRKHLNRPNESVSAVRDLLDRMVDGTARNENISWIITMKGDPAFIGSVGFWRNQPEHHRGEIGYSLESRYWNKGIMTEALRAVLKYGFEEMKLHSVEANVNPENAGSIRVLRKCGFVQEAHFRENYHCDGHFFDSFIFCLLARDFNGRDSR